MNDSKVGVLRIIRSYRSHFWRSDFFFDPGLLENLVRGMSVNHGDGNGKTAVICRVVSHFVASLALTQKLAAVGKQNIPQLRVERFTHRSIDFAGGGSLFKREVQSQGLGVNVKTVGFNTIWGNFPDAIKQRLERSGFGGQVEIVARGNPHPIFRVVNHVNGKRHGESQYVFHVVILSPLDKLPQQLKGIHNTTGWENSIILIPNSPRIVLIAHGAAVLNYGADAG